MSWSWRSKETYGDKSANFEGGEAEKPAADEGAGKKKKPVSIWEDTTDSWWDQYDKTRSTGGVGGSSTRDESYRVYSYDDAFDDSDSRWYRQNSFRYDSYRDYSPSRLFRRSFTSIGFGSGYSSSGDNELKNKAIQALRSLTRNANTVADKSAKITYSVKFSGGADSNGSGELLASKTGKQQEQTIFVSPDELAQSKTDDDTDAVVDALTGFVLLRVQIAQGVSKHVINEVNATSMTALPMRLAGSITDGRVTTANVEELTTNYTDDYAAGMLTKSMLTRLARRAVVKDWGGFAPYFVRHAKKFAAAREHLVATNENGKLSVELVAAQIAYNFMSDENPIPLAKEIEDIVTKHLGEELPAEKLLRACHDLVAELRKYLDESGKLEQGQIESSLQEILKPLAASGDKLGSAREDIGKQLDATADFLDGMAKDAHAAEHADKTRDNELCELHAQTAALKMLNKILYAIKQYGTDPEFNGSLVKVAAQPGIAAGALKAQANYAQSQIDANISHFMPRITELAKRLDLDAVALLAKNYPIVPPGTPVTEETVNASTQNYIDALKAFETKAQAAIKQETKRIKTEYVAKLKEAAAADAKLAEAFEQRQRELETLTADSQTLAAKYPQAEDLYSSLRAATSAAENHKNLALSRQEAAEKAAQSKSSPRSLDTLAIGINRAVQREETARSQMTGFRNDVFNNAEPGTHAFIQHCLTYAYKAAVEVATNPTKEFQINPEWRIDGQQAYFDRAETSQTDFQTALINQTHQALLKQLLKQFQAFGRRPKKDGDEDEESSMIETPFSKLAPEQKAQLRNVAASLGMPAETLYEILKQMSAGAKASNAKAEKLGEQIKEKLIDAAAKLSPVDEQLFGEQVQNRVVALLGASLDTVHDEATHSVEEDFVAYLNHNDARPKVKIAKPDSHHAGQHRSIVTAVRNANRRVIEQVREALVFQSSKRIGEVHGLTSGDLDEGSLHKLQYDSEYIWSQKTLTQLPDVAVGILVDQSGSMGSCNKIEQARDMCIVLAEAVKQIPGVHLHIYGHTANRGGADDLQLFEHYSSYGDASTADISGLGSIRAMSNNYDGYAIKETAKRLALDPAKRKYLFVIADGLPSGSGYGGKEAEKHVTSVCTYVRNKLKISTYAFGVGVHSPEHIRQFKTQYGENNVVFISTVKQALPKIVRFLRNVLHKEKTFVDASAD